MQNQYPGLQLDKKSGQWSIDKKIKGYGRVHQRLSASTQEEAELMFDQVIQNIHNQIKLGQSTMMTFHEAGVRYVNEHLNKRSIERDIKSLEILDKHIGHLPLIHVHNETLAPFIAERKKARIRSGTVTRDLSVVRIILNLATKSWRNQYGMPYLLTPPMLTMPKNWEDTMKSFPLDGKQQTALLKKLPLHLKLMALFAANTGLREQGICMLRWDWEVEIPELQTSIFITPGETIDYGNGQVWAGEKNKLDQIVVLNRIARKVIQIQRSRRDPDCPWVFPLDGQPLPKMNNEDWRTAWQDAGLPVHDDIRRGPHNLKHTFGRRLAAAKVPKEIRKELLHHKTRDTTDEYSLTDVELMIEMAERVVDHKRHVILRRPNTPISAIKSKKSQTKR